MKKGLLLILFAMLTTVAAQAQMTPAFGVRLGANYAGITGDDTDDLERIFGFHGGLTANLPLMADGFLSLQPELLYSMKGTKEEGDDYEYKLTLGYIDVPVLARINAGPIFFEAGPQVSFRISGKSESTFAGVTVEDEELDEFKNMALGYAAGVGFGTPMGVSIGVRYNGDISQLIDEDDAAETRNSVFMLSLAYTFGGGAR